MQVAKKFSRSSLITSAYINYIWWDSKYHQRLIMSTFINSIMYNSQFKLDQRFLVFLSSFANHTLLSFLVYDLIWSRSTYFGVTNNYISYFGFTISNSICIFLVLFDHKLKVQSIVGWHLTGKEEVWHKIETQLSSFHCWYKIHEKTCI